MQIAAPKGGDLGKARDALGAAKNNKRANGEQNEAEREAKGVGQDAEQGNARREKKAASIMRRACGFISYCHEKGRGLQKRRKAQRAARE